MSTTIKHKSASLTLRPLEDNKVWLADLYAEERMQGHATELLQKVINQADEDGIILQLDARQYGDTHGMTTGALIIFYESFGFHHVTGLTKHLMERLPKESND